jgi:hypothetical protein
MCTHGGHVYAWRPWFLNSKIEKENHVVPPRTIGGRARAARSTDRGLQHRRDGALDSTQAGGYSALDSTQAGGYSALGRTHAARAACHYASGHYASRAAGHRTAGHHASRAAGHQARSARESHPAGQRR